MSLPHAMLGFLSQGPTTGYELKKQFDVTVRHFWPADQSQIYRTLNVLVGKGWSVVERVAQADKPDQKVHHITAEGRRVLQEWLTTPLHLPPPREATLIQVFFAHQLADDQSLRILEQQRAQLAQHLEDLRQIPVSDGPADRTRFFQRLTLQHGITMLEAEIAWLDASIEQLKTRIATGWS